MKYRTAAVLIFAGISISPASAQYSTECRNKPFGLGVECTTTAPRPQENGWDRINKQIEQLRLSNEADKKAKRDEELYQLRLKEIEARRLEQMQLAQQQEQLRLQAEQVFRVQQEEERRRLLLEELNKSVSTAVLEHRCEDAKNIALQAGQLDLAERAVRLCTPAPRSKIQTKKGSSNSAGSINAGPARGKGQLPRGSISQNVDLQKSTAGSTTFSPSPVRIPSGLPVSQSQLVSVRRIAAGVAIKTILLKNFPLQCW